MAAIRFAFFIVLIAYSYAQFTATDVPTTDEPLTTSSPSLDRSFSIESSNAADPQYEWDAVQCLSESYILHPGSFDTIIKNFAELYKLKHSGNWNVNAGCSSLYVPNEKIAIVIKVTEGSSETLVTLYD